MKYKDILSHHNEKKMLIIKKYEQKSWSNKFFLLKHDVITQSMAHADIRREHQCTRKLNWNVISSSFNTFASVPPFKHNLRILVSTWFIFTFFLLYTYLSQCRVISPFSVYFSYSFLKKVQIQGTCFSFRFRGFNKL